MSARQRPWYRFDSGFPDQDTIRDLGEAHGAAGPLVMVILFCDACAAYSPKATDFDTMEAGYAGLAKRAFTDAATVRAIVARAEGVGLLQILESDDRRCMVRLLAWQKWNAKDPNAAGRQRRSRTRKSSDPAEG
jgi:hypothetical protein